ERVGSHQPEGASNDLFGHWRLRDTIVEKAFARLFYRQRGEGVNSQDEDGEWIAMTEIAYGGIESPLGGVFAAATPAGVALISFGATEEIFTADAERFLGTRAARLNVGARGPDQTKAAALAEEALA